MVGHMRVRGFRPSVEPFLLLPYNTEGVANCRGSISVGKEREVCPMQGLSLYLTGGYKGAKKSGFEI